jgi:RNA polymerase sigma-70 factor (ECF subfamily)
MDREDESLRARFRAEPARLGEIVAAQREVLVVRRFEHLTNGDVARPLGLTSGGASLRYLRAAERSRALLDGIDAGRS